jgi:hypothetical protein
MLGQVWVLSTTRLCWPVPRRFCHLWTRSPRAMKETGPLGGRWSGAVSVEVTDTDAIELACSSVGWSPAVTWCPSPCRRLLRVSEHAKKLAASALESVVWELHAGLVPWSSPNTVRTGGRPFLYSEAFLNGDDHAIASLDHGTSPHRSGRAE